LRKELGKDPTDLTIATVTVIEIEITTKTVTARRIGTMTVIATEIAIVIVESVAGRTAITTATVTGITIETVTGIETVIATALGTRTGELGIRIAASGTVADTAMLDIRMATTLA